MENPENDFNALESLKLIQEMITVTKKRIDKESFLVLFWGYFAITGYLMGYVWVQLDKYFFMGLTWGLLTIIGIIVSLIYIRTKTKKERIKTYVDDCLKYTWMGYGITVAIFMVFLIKFQDFTLINPIGLLLAGLPTFITGGVIKFKPLMIGGIVFWLFGILAFFITSDWQYLICALAIVLGYLIPGYMLKAGNKA